MRLFEPFIGTDFAEEIDEFDEATGVMDDDSEEDDEDEEEADALDSDDDEEEE